MEGEASSSAQVSNFQPNDLIWAKMKGFPPWPAKVLEKTEDTPARRIPVMFFGTLETSFMKPSDLSDYLTNRSTHEIPRKQKDFNKAVQEIRKAAGISSEQDDSQFPIAPKSPPSSPGHGRTRRTSGRFLDVILAGGPDNMKKKRSNNSASTKSRSRASSSASVYRAVKEFVRKERRKRLDSDSSQGSKRKMISGGIIGNGSVAHGSENYESNNYADSVDFNNLFGEEFLGVLADDAKSQKSKRSRGSSKMFDDLIFSRVRNRSGSASGRRSRMISMSGFSGISDMFEEFFNAPVDLDTHAEQMLVTLNNMPSDGSIDRPLSPELLAPLPAPVEFCTSCGYECRVYNGVWRCTSNHCSKYKESTQSVSAVQGMLEEENHRNRNKLDVPLSVNIKTESVSSGEKLINSMLMAKPGSSRAVEASCALSSVKAEPVSPEKKKRSNLVINLKHDDGSTSEATNVEDMSGRRDKKKRRVQVMSPRSPNIHFTSSNNLASEPNVLDSVRTSGRMSPSPRRDRTRPKHYKVEKTPPISADGHRHCVNCNGQVRPQMCGGNRHRWRCVDKKCRKWYGWVRSHEEIPKNVGRKKVQNIKSPASSKPMKIKKKEEEDEGHHYPVIKRKVGRPSKNDIKIRLKMQKEAAAAAAVRPITPQPIVNMGGMNNLQRRKYTKRKQKEAGGVKREFSPFDDENKILTEPLTEKEARYRPCAMEKRARWWTGEKRRVDVSPEREFGTTAADTAAAFRMMAQSVRSAAVTRADEVGTVNGSLDLLMDSLIGAMAPLLSLLQKVPPMKMEPDLSQQLWNSSAVHIPTFQ